MNFGFAPIRLPLVVSPSSMAYAAPILEKGIIIVDRRWRDRFPNYYATVQSNVFR